MYRSAVILIFTFALLLLMFIVVAQMFVVVERLAVIDEHSGSAQVLWRDQARPAALGALVRAGERVRTGQDARIGLHWADGSRIEVGPNSELVVQRCRRNRAKHTSQSRFRLNVGEIWIRVRGALEPGSKFEVETPTIVAAVRGTVFAVRVCADGTTSLEVYRGEVEIRGDGVGQGVASGRFAIVGKGRFDVRRMSKAERQSWRDVEDITGPLLVIMEPAPGITTSMPLAPVHGRTEEQATVSINGEPVSVDRKGVFRGRARLVEGANVITIVCTLGGADLKSAPRATIHREVTYVNPTREIVLTSRPATGPHDPPGALDITAVLRDEAGDLVGDGTPVEVLADRGVVARQQRTTHGAVVAKWRPGGADLKSAPLRVIATSGGASATIIVDPTPMPPSAAGVAAPAGRSATSPPPAPPR